MPTFIFSTEAATGKKIDPKTWKKRYSSLKASAAEPTAKPKVR